VLKSVSRNPAPDPLFFIPGGPGEAATESFLVLSSAFEHIRQKRDIVLVDQRGTGGSNPLRCPETEDTQDSSQPEDLGEAAIRQSLQACLAGLEGNPALYTTAQAVEDLEQVRSSMGYEQIDLYGASYGTRVALAYLRQYPSRVRTVILDGVAPPNWTLGVTVSQDAQRALDMIFQRCADDPQCNRTFPDLPARFGTLLQTLKKGPVQLTLANPVSGEIEDFTLTYDFFANAYTSDTPGQPPCSFIDHTTFERAI
jgi:pimeloyl-ACP methyl ester carboxylesterase